ncbi:MAG TPA: hypothetical protein VFZ66_29610 [Herpetosiphonaceae bacterium]
MSNIEFQQAVMSTDWSAVEAMVYQHLSDDVSRDGLADWLEEGDWKGTETAESVAAEWTELDQQVEGVDY